MSQLIRERYDRLPSSRQAIASFITDNIDLVAFASAREVGNKLDVSGSSIVRFAQLIGFAGYPQMQRAAQQEVQRRASSTKVSQGSIISLNHHDAQAVLAADHANIEATLKEIPADQFEDAIDAIVSFDKILVFGTDRMAFFASYFRQLLQMLDIRVETVTSASQDDIVRLARMNQQTLLVTLLSGPPHVLAIRALRLARQRGSHTLAISDSKHRDLAAISSIMLNYKSQTPAFVKSHAALLSLLHALSHGIYSRDMGQYSERIRAYRKH